MPWMNDAEDQVAPGIEFLTDAGAADDVARLQHDHLQPGTG